MIYEEFDKAREELKRADHLVYVTLKYTRTVDVIKNIITRFISVFEAVTYEYLEYLKEKNKIKQIPDSAKLRAELLQKMFKGKIKEYIKLYNLLKKINKAEYSKEEEFRKHVALVAHIRKKDIKVDIPTLVDYFKKTKEFMNIIHEEIKWL